MEHAAADGIRVAPRGSGSSPPGFSPRGERLAALASGALFDVLVVGGGITGAAVARDAASRGLTVALVERGDWACGTSWRSSKLVHGGLRYLRTGDFRLVFESLSERARLLRLAPHLVRPLEFVFAALNGRWVSPLALSAGLTMYDLLALGRGPRHRRLSRRALLTAEPLLNGADVGGGALYTDASADDARVTLENALDAAFLGAVAISRVAVVSHLRTQAGATAGVAVRDLPSGQTFEVRARVTIDATGPWSDALRRSEDPRAAPRLRLSKGAHVTVPAASLPVRRAVAIPVEAGRLVFAIPLGPVTLIGTTDEEWTGSPDAVGPTSADVEYLLARSAEAFPGHAPGRADVVAAFAAVRPLRFEPGVNVSATSREQSIESFPGAVAVTGGKLTTHRRMAARAVDVAARQLRSGGITPGAGATAERLFPGAPALLAAGGEPPSAGDFEDRFARESAAVVPETVARHLARRFGSRAGHVVAADGRPAPGGGAPFSPLSLSGDLPDCLAEAAFAARFEDARSASDVLIRRTHLFWQAPDQGLSALPAVQEILRRELAWTPAEEERSAAEYREEVARSRKAVSGV